MFPQFSYATGGSCARFFEQNLCGRTLEKILWIPSYESHSAFIEAYKKQIKTHIQKNNLREEDVCLFYSCHGVPRKFVCFNDPYEKHCQLSYQALKAHFPHADHVLAFQSKFGKGEWLRPYTIDLVEKDLSWCQKKHVLFVPLSFTSDHIETLHEIENEYIQPLKDKGIDAQRINSLSDDFSWVCPIIEDRGPSVSNAMLIRKDKAACCQISHDCCLCKQKSSKKNLFKGQVQQDRR